MQWNSFTLKTFFQFLKNSSVKLFQLTFSSKTSFFGSNSKYLFLVQKCKCKYIKHSISEYDDLTILSKEMKTFFLSPVKFSKTHVE